MDWPFSENLNKTLSEIRKSNKQIIQSRLLEEFENALLDYEQIFSKELNGESFQEREFSDFSGLIKPVIMGDENFLLVTWRGSKEELIEYFARYGLYNLYHLEEWILNGN